MATDFAIRIRLDEAGSGGVPSTQVLDVVQSVIQAIRQNTLAISNAASYTAGDRTYNALISVNTVTTADYGIEILIDSAVAASVKARILRDILAALAAYTLALTTLATTYAAGTTSVNQITITVT